MSDLGRETDQDVRLYFTGGATAVLFGWRTSTIDVDVKIDPETDQIFRALPRIKDRLEINIELAAPDQFIPEVPGWQERSVFIGREGRLSFYHYDFYAQALSKILIHRPELGRRFEEIEPKLYHYPGIDPASFRKAVEKVLAA
jgi:hypothetical protein